MNVAGFVEHFLLGVVTPLTAACVIPLYPAFLSYLASTGDREGGWPVAVLGGFVMAGVLLFMALAGLLFTFVLGESINRVVEGISPIAFVILFVVGAILLISPKAFSRVPTVDPPQSRYPGLTAVSYGFFFGAIIIPCNPGTISLFFARTPVLYDTHAESMIGFLAFGLGIGAPLLAFAVLSEPFSKQVTTTLARYSGQINRTTGAILTVVAAYYLLFVFELVTVPV